MINHRLEEHHERMCLGFDPGYVGLGHADQCFLDCAIRAHPHWSRVVELGTYCGVTAAILGATMMSRGGCVVTVDKNEPPAEVRRAWHPNVTFMKEDICPDGQVNNALAALISSSDCLVVVDGGNKPLEVRKYWPYVRNGSALVVHDWGGTRLDGEITWEDIADMMKDAEPLGLALALSLRSAFRGWIRR